MFSTLQGVISEAIKQMETLYGNKLSSADKELTKKTDSAIKILETLQKQVEKALLDQQRGINFIYDKARGLKNGKDGKPGAKGDKGDPGTPGKNGTEITAEEVRDLLESFQDPEDYLDANFIKNLPEATKHIIATATSLWNLQDVDVSGIVAGQALKWDGVRWIPFTPAGGNTSVYNEVVSGSGTSFTLANTPVSGTLRVYANGQRLLPTTDFSLSTATITTVLSWSAGSISADYEYV